MIPVDLASDQLARLSLFTKLNPGYAGLHTLIPMVCGIRSTMTAGNRWNIGSSKIVALEQQRLSGGFGKRVGKAIAEI